MSLHKPDAIMAAYPTTNSNIEPFHSYFAHAVPRQRLPLFMAAGTAYYYAKNCLKHAESIQEGTRKEKRKRGIERRGPQEGGHSMAAPASLLSSGRTIGPRSVRRAAGRGLRNHRKDDWATQRPESSRPGSAEPQEALNDVREKFAD